MTEYRFTAVDRLCVCKEERGRVTRGNGSTIKPTSICCFIEGTTRLLAILVGMSLSRERRLYLSLTLVLCMRAIFPPWWGYEDNHMASIIIQASSWAKVG